MIWLLVLAVLVAVFLISLALASEVLHYLDVARDERAAEAQRQLELAAPHGHVDVYRRAPSGEALPGSLRDRRPNPGYRDQGEREAGESRLESSPDVLLDEVEDARELPTVSEWLRAGAPLRELDP